MSGARAVFVQFNCAEMWADLGVGNTATRQVSRVVALIVLVFFYNERQ